MHFDRVLSASNLLVLLLVGACSTPKVQQRTPTEDPRQVDATRLPTGVILDPAGVMHPVGPMPLSIAVAPDSAHVVLLLNGYSRTGIQVVEWKTGRISQTLDLPAAFLGLAFSPNGKELYASGGNTDAVYQFHWADGKATLADSIPLGARVAGRRNGTRYPSQLAFSRDGRFLYVAENLDDSLAVIDVSTKRVVQRQPTGRYPYGVVVAPDERVFVSSWGGEFVAEYSLNNGRLANPEWVAAGRHPSALLLDKAGARLFVASGSTDRIAVIDTRTRRTIAELRDPPGSGPDEGSTPNALVLSPDESKLYAAEADGNAVAVFDLSAPAPSISGRIPTGWYPAALATIGSSLVVANGKGSGTHADINGPGPRKPGKPAGSTRNGTLGQLSGTLSVIDLSKIDERALTTLSVRVARANGWNRPHSETRFPPFEHVIYIIRENRTYDQVLGDVSAADGDTSLVYFGKDVTPNAHALVERYGVFDRFFVNAEVSADGHNWTTAAYASDYVEKTVQPNYSSRGRTYDYEGTNRGKVPEDDVNEPASGYIWTVAAKAGISLRNYGEFVVGRRQSDGDEKYIGNKPQLAKTTNPDYPGFNLDIRDQKRADVWLAELQRYVERGTMPALEIVRLPNDHTSGGAAGKPSPRAQAADNDLALGRMISALTRTPFWRSTVVFVLEDDAQNGPDHVDSHRSPLLVISPYGRPGVYHRFTNTTDVVRSIEGILKLESLSHFDYFGRPLTDIWAEKPDLTPFDMKTPAVSLDERNPGGTRGARDSRRLKLETEDASNDDDFSAILWHVVKGYDRTYPGPTRMSALEARRGR